MVTYLFRRLQENTARQARWEHLIRGTALGKTI